MRAIDWGLTVLALVVFQWGYYWKSRFHRAKAEVYQEFADSFNALLPAIRSPKERRRLESKRRYMRLALCDPLVRDGLWDALNEADTFWGRLYSDPPRTP